MATKNVTSEVAKVLASDGSGGLTNPPSLRAQLSIALRDSQADAASPTVAAGSSATANLNDAVRQNSDQLTQLKSVFQSQIDSIAENTNALVDNTTSKGQSVASALGDAAKGIGSTILGGLSLSPIIGGLMKLFGGGGETAAPPPVIKYAPPAAINLQTGISGGQLSGLDYSAGGQARSVSSPAPAPAASNVTVNVQAIDSRSFLDYSDAIAAAVKKAMLDSNSLNDVVSEL
jgi:hypothetical protein